MTRHSKHKTKTIENERRAVNNKKSMVQGELDKLTAVDVHKNFKLHNCFGSINVIELFKTYMYESVVPALNEFFELRMKMNEN